MTRLSLPSDEYAALKLYVLRRDMWRCRACKHRNNLHVHHVVFRSQQGPDTPENCATLCSDCHDAIHVHQTIRVVGDNADIPGGMKFLRMPQ
jgi:5-methylcytosine-specific restriction endonuclease McrA